jgi:hypothetical protein
MKPHWYLFAVGLLLVVAGLVITAQTPALAQDPPTEDPLGEPPVFLREFYDSWVQSAHAAAEAEAFVHWNADGEIPESCARCHSTTGYRDFLGEDGSEFGTVDAPAALGTVINCDACHNGTASTLSSVTFPSGAEITDIGESARCMVCHQGRASTVSVNTALEEAGVMEDLNQVSADLSFINIHYYAAAASLYGSEVHGGYEFEGQSYQPRFQHTPGYTECFDCHNPHTLEVRVAECTGCHEGVETAEDLRNIRMNGSLVDYDGDGDIEEGIASEISTLQELLYQSIQAYATEVVGTSIIYDEHSHPYFFIDTNGNGEVDEGEVNGDNRYNAFTGYLLQATYNYQVSLKDPGNFAHNAKYHIELLYDSIQVLNEQLQQVEPTALHRNDAGHFDATGEPFRHWDAEGEVPATCSKCHTSEGLPFLIDQGVTIAFEPSDSLSCSTCHDNIGELTLWTIDEVTLPSGATVSFGEGKSSNVCLNCHQGRESTVSVNAAITRSGVGPDEVSEELNFRNPHYFAAGATLFGGDAMGAYQFDGMEYNGQNEHTRRFDECADCHNEHSLEIRSSLCHECHEVVESPEDIYLIRLEEDDDVEGIDYNGNGDAAEPIKSEIDTLHAELLARIQAYAADTIGTSVAYNAASYPYWFIDTNENGTADPEEANRDNGYAQWTPNLLRAAYNYQYVAKDPGAFAHNPDYILQVLYDSLQAMGGDEAVASYTRPPVR